ncbi:hypothetical protein ACFSLT_20435 [Novosphingobium resinovorum]
MPSVTSTAIVARSCRVTGGLIRPPESIASPSPIRAMLRTSHDGTSLVGAAMPWVSRMRVTRLRNIIGSPSVMK